LGAQLLLIVYFSKTRTLYDSINELIKIGNQHTRRQNLNHRQQY